MFSHKERMRDDGGVKADRRLEVRLVLKIQRRELLANLPG